MLIHTCLIICCMVSVELFIRSNFKLTVSSLMAVSQKAIKIIKSKNISDHWKEKIIPLYAISMFKYSIKSFFILSIIVSFFFLPSFLINDFIFFSISLLGIIESFIICIVYLKTRSIIF
jgi:hypothetical protein